LITRTKSQSKEFRELLEAAGARVLEAPAIEIRPRMSRQLDEAIFRLESYDWLLLTSANAAAIFADQVAHLRPELRPENLQRPQLCTIGPATAQMIENYGYRVSLIPGVFQAEGVIEEFVRAHQGGIAGLRILLPRAARAREILPAELRRLGAVVDLIPVYDTVIPDDAAPKFAELLGSGKIDLITFTSSSTVHNFVQAAGSTTDLSRFTYAAIGPVTSSTAAEYGLQVSILPMNWTVPDLARAIMAYFEEQQGRQGLQGQ